MSIGVVNTITKLTKTCVVRLTVDNIFFVLSGKVANGGVSMWCELLQVKCIHPFIMYRLECIVQHKGGHNELTDQL